MLKTILNKELDGDEFNEVEEEEDNNVKFKFVVVLLVVMMYCEIAIYI